MFKSLTFIFALFSLILYVFACLGVELVAMVAHSRVVSSVYYFVNASSAFTLALSRVLHSRGYDYYYIYYDLLL